MHTSKDDYLINTLRFVSAKESTQIYGKLLPITLTSPEIKESKAYASGAVPPKIARKFKKASPSKKDSSLVPVDDEPTKRGKRVKRSIKKSTTTLSTCIIIREAPVETRSKRIKKVDVAHGKGIDLLSEVALTEEAQMKEVRKKSLRDFHKTHPNGSGTVAKKPPRVDKIPPTITSEGTGDKPGVLDDTDGSESDSEFDQQEYKEEVKDDDKEEYNIVHTMSNSNDEEDANLESNNDDKSEGDEDRGMDDMTNQFSDDVQNKEADVEMTDAQQEKGSLDITQEQVVEDAHSLSSLMSSASFPQDSDSFLVESSSVTLGTPGLSPVPSLMIVDVILSTLGGFSETVPEPLGCVL
uniref:Uncharacterized protein n=1 Tax=Tanacetum cinerariifolium TaxID=118510 RepID=A0A6L2MDS3_TANCI|nr:hypothetical protein [Tanacetum cinerariifolium]